MGRPDGRSQTDQTLTGRLASPRLRLRVTATAETLVRGGHPWVFSDSVREQNRAATAGELAAIYDRKNAFLALGLFDPDSPIRVRVLVRGKPEIIDADWWAKRLALAIERRAGLFDAQTDGYRWINGESDGWPGLVLDRYAETLVLKLYTVAWLPWLETVLAAMVEKWPGSRIVLRLSRNIATAARTRFAREDGQWLRGTPGDLVLFQESGLRFEANVTRGQKTGFFLDQRENRRLVETLAQGRDTLNAFSFNGGFALYAARGGAKSVANVDISEHALASAERNWALNRALPAVAACAHELIRADAFAWLAEDSARRFDLIILDPPSLAKRESERAAALHAYGRLTSDALRRLRPHGILVAASCSAHVSAEEFFTAARQSLQRSRRPFIELQTTRHTPDHPVTIREADYLKCIYFRVGGDE